jgi:hypothetical protein
VRTVEEITALIAAAKFTLTLTGKGRRAAITTRKGDDQVLVLVEPAMTLHVDDGTKERRIVCPEAGPMTRVAMAWHLGLTPEEAAQPEIDLTIEAAEAGLRCWAKELIERAGVADVLTLQRVDPTSEEWGR